MKKNILFIQPDCREYRVELYKKLSCFYNISILHFGQIAQFGESNINQIIGKRIRLGSLNYIISLKNICQNYDAIISTFDPHWINAFFVSFITNVPTIMWGHGLGKSKIIINFRRLIAKKSALLLTYDKGGKRDLVSVGIDKNKIFVAPNTVHVPNMNDHSCKEKNSILYVGRLQARKELDSLIKIFALSRDRLPLGTMLKIVGNGSKVLQENLKQVAVNLGVKEMVQFIEGTTDNVVLSKHFETAYCYISPGHVGLSVLHSFGYGIPVMTFKNKEHAPEVSNIENMRNGVLIEGNEDEFANKLCYIINSGKYKELGHNAFQYYTNQRTLNVLVRSFVKAINHVIR